MLNMFTSVQVGHHRLVKYVQNDQSLSAAVYFSEASMKVHFSPDFTTRPSALHSLHPDIPLKFTVGCSGCGLN